MTNFDAFQTEDRRLSILLGLKAAAQYTSNAFLLRSFVATLGHVVSADRLETDLVWLQEQGLLVLSGNERVRLATLNERGLDVATGAATVPGVKRPQPHL